MLTFRGFSFSRHAKVTKAHPDGIPGYIHRTGRPWSALLATVDSIIMVLSYWGAVNMVGFSMRQHDLVAMLVIGMVAYPGRLPYRRFNRSINLYLIMNWLLAVAFLAAVGALLRSFFPTAEPLIDWSVLLVWAPLSLAALLALHLLTPLAAPYMRRFYGKGKALIVGTNESALRLGQLIERGEIEGQQLIGFIDDRSHERLRVATPEHVLGPFSELGAIAKREGVDTIYLGMPMTSHARLQNLLEQLRDTTVSVYFVPDISISDVIQGSVTVLGGVPMLAVCETPFMGSIGMAKRFLDLAICVAILPVVLPVLGVIALLIKVSSPGPVIFKQRRFGLGGEEITMLKFRTMKVMEDGQNTYTQVTRADDRVTPLGRILRKTSLDELPQLLNVLGGSMSLVGPRPHALAVNEQFRQLIPGYMVRHKVKPGITGWAQVNGCRGGDDLESMRKRTAFDLEYLRSWTSALDLVILWKTALMLIRGDKNAF